MAASASLRAVMSLFVSRTARGAAVLVPLHGPAARHDEGGAVPPRVHELALPVAGALELGVDLRERRRKHRLKELVRAASDRLRPAPAVRLLGAAVPVGDHVVRIADEHHVGRQIEERRLLPHRLVDGLGAGELPDQRREQHRAQQDQQRGTHATVERLLAPGGERRRRFPAGNDQEREGPYASHGDEPPAVVPRPRYRTAGRAPFLRRGERVGFSHHPGHVKSPYEERAVVSQQGDSLFRAEPDRVVQLLKLREVDQRDHPPGEAAAALDVARHHQHGAVVDSDQSSRGGDETLGRERLRLVDERSLRIGDAKAFDRCAGLEGHKRGAALLARDLAVVRFMPLCDLAHYDVHCLKPASRLVRERLGQVAELAVGRDDGVPVRAPDAHDGRRREGENQQRAAEDDPATQEQAAGGDPRHSS